MTNDSATTTTDDAEKIAAAIKAISEATASLLRAGLNRHALSVLLAASTGLPRKVVLQVIDGLESLSALYLSKSPAKAVRK